MTKAQIDIDNFSEQKPRRRSGPKVFQCTGYGECNMVFTRQEHLNRHERKHTGEASCQRMFTRNDNMRQHAERCPYKNTLNSIKRNPERSKGRKKYCEDSEAEPPSPKANCHQDIPELPPAYHQLDRPRRSAPKVIFSSHPYKPTFYNKPVYNKPKRRVSTQDLFSSIDRLEDISHSEEEENGVDLTEDEYQALLGFREFHRAAVTMPCV
ncbi:hypothetical protein CU098_011340 [Rhizopus stolonifer]|uniref:C2H2-type domain-containing protein n=1 Tax=Rhizopus stolonifer TaxID=4846 RepID=A0A367K7Y4_RHIST|nr:hypothetical protein CU098_011340 [Rhizopus stolonifer]